MPFEPAPQPEVKTFQKFADAIMRGCEMRPIQCSNVFFRPGAACALGAMALGLGFNMSDYDDAESGVECFLPDSVCHAYFARYGISIPDDNDYQGLTREQIAARIAAL